MKYDTFARLLSEFLLLVCLDVRPPIINNFHGGVDADRDLVPHCSQHFLLVENLARQLLCELAAIDELVLLLVEVPKVTLEKLVRCTVVDDVLKVLDVDPQPATSGFVIVRVVLVKMLLHVIASVSTRVLTSLEFP